jgi:hypothetical protein
MGRDMSGSFLLKHERLGCPSPGLLLYFERRAFFLALKRNGWRVFSEAFYYLGGYIEPSLA